MKRGTVWLVAAVALSLSLFMLAACGNQSASSGSASSAKAAEPVKVTWINFAKTGDPSIDGVTWKAYNADTRDTMVIEKDKWECVSDPSKPARELLAKAYGDEPYHVW